MTALSKQNLNDSLLLECNITTVRGITNSMDIVWRANGTVIKRKNNTSGYLVNNSVVYTDVYHTFNVGDGVTLYQCQGVINGSTAIIGRKI